MKLFRHLINVWLHFMKIVKKFFLPRRYLISLFEPQAKLNFSSSNPNRFYIVKSNTITDKCTLVRDLYELFQQHSFPPH